MKKTLTLLIEKSFCLPCNLILLLGLVIMSQASMAQSPYCTPTQTYDCNTFNMSINAVDIKDPSSTSIYSRAHNASGYGGCTGATGYYTLWSTSSMFTLKSGDTYKMGFTTGVSYPVNIMIWLDLNRDNDFADANEFFPIPACVYATGNVYNGTSSLTYFDVKIPKGAPGVTRMRIRSSYYYTNCFSAGDDGCTAIPYGEAEDYTVTLQAASSDDASLSTLIAPQCGPEVKATVTNYGGNDLNSVQIGWIVDGTAQTVNSYTSTLTPGSSANITLKNTGNTDYNFVDGNTYTLKVFTFSPNGNTDGDKKDDTITVKFKYNSPPADPKPKDVTRCGGGSVTLNAGLPPNTLAMWYNSSTSTTLLRMDTTYNTPFLYPGIYNYYVQSAKLGSKVVLSNGTVTAYWWGSNNPSGVMWDLEVKNTVVLDSVSVNVNSGALMDAKVWIKTGTHVGYQNQSSAWTLIASVSQIQARSLGNPTYVNLGGYILPKGNYGMYVEISLGVTFNIMAQTVTTPDLVFKGGSALIGSFAASGYGSNYTSITNIDYRPLLCVGAKVPVKVTVKPAPYGAGFTKGTPFQTTTPNTSGTLSSPDIVAKGDTITWLLTPPTGYSNATYGSAWLTGNPVVLSKKGYAIDPKYWVWSAPNGSNPGKFTFFPNASIVDSTYTVSLQIRDLGPHYCDSTITRNIFVAPRPVPDFKFNSPICDGDAVLFNDASTISSGGLSYRWDFGTGNAADTATINTTVFTFPTFGTYNVKLTVTSTPYGYQETIIIPVVVTEIPKIGFKVLNACEKVAIKFNNTTTIGAGTVTYVWDFGETGNPLAKSTQEHPTFIYKTAGAYKVTLRASASGCTSELTKNANQFATPKASFTYPSLICDKSDVQFTNGSTIKMGNMGYNWNFGDGGVSNFANPIHQFATATNKTVKLKAVSEFGCMDSISQTIALKEAPTADFIWGPACNLSNTDFTFKGTKPSGFTTTFNWDFAGEGTTTIENPSKLFSIVGKKNVTLTLLSNNNCMDVITKEVDVKLQSKADFEIEDVCEDDDAVFTNTSTVSQGNLLYNWKFGDNTTSSNHSPRHLYSIGGVSKTFNVTLVAIVPGGCSDSINKPVSVNAKPISNFIFSTSGRRVSFTANQPGNTSYTWRFGDGGSSTNANPVYDYTAFASGKYQACLAVINAAGCFSETCNEVNITGGIESIVKTTGVKVYPNPNHGSFTVSVEDPKSDIAIAVYNLLGEVVKTIETNPLKSTYSIDINVANGVYMVKVTNGGLSSTQKVTISK